MNIIDDAISTEATRKNVRLMLPSWCLSMREILCCHGRTEEHRM